MEYKVNPYHSERVVTYAHKGMVATSQPLAAQAGLDIIKKGGNAVDAAVATAACLTVVEPISNGLGGDAFAIVWLNNEMYGLNSSGPAPKAISIEAVNRHLQNFPDDAPGGEYSRPLEAQTMPVRGWIPVTVPGIPAAWAALNKRFGNLSLKECLAPAISYAENGYPISPILGRYWGRSFPAYKGFEEWCSTFAPKGRAPKIGEIWSSPNHAATLKEIAYTDAESFYRGPIADKIIAESNKGGGFFDKSDLSDYSPEWVTPISVNYRGYDVWELPPNGQGLVALIALNILKGFDFKTEITAETYHLQWEAIKLAFAAGIEYITDPRHMKVSVEDLLSDAYTDTLRSKIGSTAQDPAPVKPAKGGTVYLATADGDGNMVSYIQSNYTGFGSGIVIPGTGIAMQNRGHDFSLNPDHSNCLQGGKRTYHTIIPGFLTKSGQAVGPFGVMGGYMQPQGHVQVLMNSIDFGHSPQAVLDAPRWIWAGGKRFDVERSFPNHIGHEMVLRGHEVGISTEQAVFGRGQVIWRDSESGVLAGGTEPRADGAVVGW